MLLYVSRVVNNFASYLTIVISLLVLKRQIKQLLYNSYYLFSLLSFIERKNKQKKLRF